MCNAESAPIPIMGCFNQRYRIALQTQQSTCVGSFPHEWPLHDTLVYAANFNGVVSDGRAKVVSNALRPIVLAAANVRE